MKNRHVIAALVVLTAFGVARSTLAINVFGKDRRQALNIKKLPQVGLLLSGDGFACTATLVARDLVVTAAHCVTEPETGQQIGRLVFYAGYRDGEFRGVSAIKKVYTGKGGNRKAGFISTDDWALLKLTRPLGDALGKVAVEKLSTAADHDASDVFSIGYSSDFLGGDIASFDSDCRLTATEVHSGINTLLHNCSTRKGASGGPLLYVKDGKAKIIAINSSERRYLDKTIVPSGVEYADSIANVAVPSERFYDKLKELTAPPSEPEAN